VKQSIMTEANGIPPAIVISGANTHDMKLLNDTLDGLAVLRPTPTPEKAVKCLPRRRLHWRKRTPRGTWLHGAHPPARGGEGVDCAFPGIQGATLGCGGLPFLAQPFPQDTRAFREKSTQLFCSRAIRVRS